MKVCDTERLSNLPQATQLRASALSKALSYHAEQKEAIHGFLAV